jgi:putative AdoMet-dependent methyltransferase
MNIAAEPVRYVVTQFALYHLSDFWKVAALQKINRTLLMGGSFLLHDVVFSFRAERYDVEIQRWINDASTGEGVFSTADFEAHVREEHSTYSWILEGIIRETGFAIRKTDFRSPTVASYWCEKVRNE